ncbi:MAG: c-type cytochrome [Acidobacteria bacterium]|nr:c-type cytochrome [Acidobacteriota bacterium]
MSLRNRPENEQEPEIDEHAISGMNFFPDFAIREAATAFVFLGVLLVLASITKPSLDPVADPNSSGFVPRPEWYFLWFFYLLKFFKGEMEVLGTFGIPVVGIGLLVSLPFLDRKVSRTMSLLPGTRPVRLWPRVTAGALILALGSLTIMAAGSRAPMTQQGPVLTPSQAVGQTLYGKMGCATCHAIGGKGGTRAPDLTHFGSKPGAQQRVLLHFAGLAQAPGSSMPTYELAPEEIRSLIEYLLILR